MIHISTKDWKVAPTLEAWDNLRPELNTYLKDAGLSEEKRISFLVAIEEMFVNIVNYGEITCQSETGPYIEIVAKDFPICDEHTVHVTLVDSGKEFDPTQYSLSELASIAQQKKMGGWGIFMARTKTSNMVYQRSENKNHLTMILNYSEEEEQA